MLAETVCDIARPFFRVLPSGRIRILSLLGGGRQNDERWVHAKRRLRVFWDRDIEAYVTADLADWGGRWHYYGLRYYDRLNQIVIQKWLRPGDIYIDVGANLGMHTLLASRQVGDDGLVLALEPNPRTHEIAALHLSLNRRTNVRLLNIGASDGDGQLELVGDPSHSGIYSVIDHGQGADRVTVQLTSVDRLVQEIPSTGKRVLVKVDVEGFEYPVLAGMQELLKQRNVLVSMEVTPEWMAKIGHSVDDIEKVIRQAGYRVLIPVKRRSPFKETRFALQDGALPRVDQSDVVLATDESIGLLRGLYEPRAQ